MSDESKCDPPADLVALHQARAALQLILAIQRRREVHLGRSRYSGIERGCILCIAELGLGKSGDDVRTEDFDRERTRIENDQHDMHRE